MVFTILKWLGVAMILSLVALWLWQGGFWRIAEYADIIPNPAAEGWKNGGDFALPGQPEMWEVPDTTSLPDDGAYGSVGEFSPSDMTGRDGERSPYSGFIFLQPTAAFGTTPKDEYLVIRAGADLTGPVSISGWTIQSALSGESAVVPLAANPFTQGVINEVGPVRLNAHDAAIVSSGPSPIGVSFRETSCSGYLAATQQFTPPLSNMCPRPADYVPRTPENEQLFGSTCFDYIERLPPCSIPSRLPSNVTASCRSFIANTYTYNGCTAAASRLNMPRSGPWRLYVTSDRELWRNTRDVIRLLDSHGRVVDTVSY